MPRCILCLVLAPVLAFSQDGGIQWEASLDEGLAKAAAEGKPLMVAFLMMNESANEQIMRVHFRNRKIIEESRNFVCVVSCPGIHAATPDHACPELNGIKCGVHDAVSTPARTRLLETSKVSCPQFLFLGSDGKTTLVHHVWLLGPEELLGKMVLARSIFDPSKAPPGFKDHRDQVTRLLDQAKDGNAAKREEALRTLARLDDPKIVEFFILQTKKNVASTQRLEAVKFMRSKGNAKVLPCLHRLMREDDANLRVHVAAALQGIAMNESVDLLVEILGKESKDRVRAHIWRAILGCSTDLAPLKPVVLQQLGLSGQLNQAIGLWAAAFFPGDAEIAKKVVSGLASSNDMVKRAAIFAAGSLKLKDAKGKLETMRKSAKDELARNIAWAIGMIDQTFPEDAEEPETRLVESFPDPDLYKAS